MDSDDFVAPSFCKTLLDLIDNTDLAICSYHRVSEQQNSFPTRENQYYTYRTLNQDSLWAEVFGRLNNATWNKLYRKSLLQEIRFSIGIIHGEDLLFNLHYLLHCQSGRISSAPLYYYRQRHNSITSASFSKRKLFEMTSKDIAAQFIQEHHPAQYPNTLRYCFRARLNVVRSIYQSNAAIEEHETISQCRKYLNVKYQ